MAIQVPRTHADPTVSGFDVSAALRDLGQLSDALREDIAVAVVDETEVTRRQAEALAPRGRSGRYHTAIRSKIFHEADGSTTGKVFVIQLPWFRYDRTGRTLWPKNLPLWLEYGTAKMAARPHLIPAFEAGKRRLDRAIERILQRVGRAA